MQCCWLPGTRCGAGTGHVPIKNFTTNIYDVVPEDLEKYGGPYIRSHFDPKPSPCWACRMQHCHRLTFTEGPFKGYVTEEPEYEGMAAFGPLIGITDITASIFLSGEVLKRVAKDIPIGTMFRGVWPFVISTAVFMGVIFLAPSLATWLPGL